MGSQTYLARFVGGPLDGRWETFSGSSGSPLPTVTHVHLHNGPKILHHYDLRYTAEQGWEYRLRPVP
ncbi:hypothetical protein SAMN05444320_112114 [Streptoalloteichus hindustanus]|uniref:Uncharacterized protein n=1 Tax=Streptoalloteichus hindustanus TaxID=2017 RepID=A0A1M5LZ47_STRHI|nr:hypothetical protein SAMN05444320_112114 [Streptoalloteichus hindustanus]